MQEAIYQVNAGFNATSSPATRRRSAFFSSLKINWYAILLTVVFVFTSACSTPGPQKPPTPEKPMVVQKPSAPQKPRLERKLPPPKMPVDGIIIVLSDMSPAFSEVEREIKKIYKKQTETYELSPDGNANRALLKKIQSSDIPVVVAIGFQAAKFAQNLTNKKVVFCQVFNYEDAGLVSDSIRGVAAIPPINQLFHIWKLMYPDLKQIGVITGKNLRGLMTEAHNAARDENLELVHLEVRSDKETLYAYKKISLKIQGLWLVPDNRVLSREVIRDIMSYSAKEGKQVVVFSYELLALGGLLSAESYYADVAEQVINRVKFIHAGPGAPITPLTKTNVRVNFVIAKRFNLPLPGLSDETKHDN